MSEAMRDYLAAILVLLGIAVVFWLGRRRRATRGAGQAERAERLNGTAGERIKLQKAVEKLQVNLMEFSRDVEGRLDTRIQTLSALIRDADERIKQLEESAGAAPAAQVPDEEPALNREVCRLADSGLDHVEIARQTSITPGEVQLILGLRRSRVE